MEQKERFLHYSSTKFNKNAIKRNILSTLASIYDPLGFVSLCSLLGKIIYRNLCDLKFHGTKKSL